MDIELLEQMVDQLLNQTIWNACKQADSVSKYIVILMPD